MKKLAVIVSMVAMAIAGTANAQDKKWFAGPTLGSTWTQGSNLGFNGGSSYTMTMKDGAGAPLFCIHPAGGVHYDGSAGAEGAIVQIIGMGPSKTTFLYPKEGDFGKPRKLN